MRSFRSPSRRRHRAVLAGAAAAALTSLAFVAPAGAAPAVAPDTAPARAAIAAETPVSSTGGVGTMVTSVPATLEKQVVGTGQATPGVAAPTSGPGLGPDSIILPDQRYQPGSTTVYPHSAVVQITINGGAHCTGWLYGPDIVATAGHCVHSGGSGGSWYVSGMQIWPGRNGASAPYGSCGATQLYSVYGWTNNGDEAYDYGAIKLNCTIGNSTGWFGYWWQSAGLSGATRICGYPGDKPDNQWCSDDIVRASQTEQVFYQNDTVGGMSGSPVYQSRTDCGWCAMGVHAYGLHGSAPHSNNNHGTRFTQAKFNNLWTWKYGVPPG
ncbi:MAG TPA: trypsin-like serine protease [Pseudonocardiaceae bacterium]